MVLPPDGTLLLYTDGVTDARDMGGVAFGVERLKAALLVEAGRRADVLCQQLLETVARYEGGVARFDDITLVAMHRLG